MKFFKNLKVKAAFLVVSISLMAAGAIYVIPFEASACNKCVTADDHRKCGICKSPKLFVKKSWVNNKGKLLHYYKCDNCGHDFVADTKGVIYTNEKVPED